MYLKKESKMLLSLIVIVLSGFTCFGITDAKVNETQPQNYNKFLKYIFNKYGSKGIITFEGLEHLMHSLGIGGLEFSPPHTIYEHRPEGFRVPEEESLFSVSDQEIVKDEDDENRKVTLSLNSFETKIENVNYKIDKKNEKEDTIIEDAQQIKALNVVSDEDKWRNNLWQEIIFKELHDPKHRHPRHHDHFSNSCLSPKSIVHLILETKNKDLLKYQVSHETHDDEKPKNVDELHDTADESVAPSVKITPSTFLELCPALLVQIDQGACSDKHDHKHEPYQYPDKKPVMFNYAWLYATICVFIISICGLAGVAIVPLAKSVAYDEILRFLVALAVGTLCGDALMHLLPHALTPHEEQGHEPEEEHGEASEHGHDEPVWLCCCAFMSALFMYALEQLLPLLRGDDSHHGHSHQHPATVKNNLEKRGNGPEDIEIEIDDGKRKELNIMLDEKNKDSKSPSLSPIAFMVILGDGLHNITDGLAIGAAFAADPVTGMATSLAILCHELPHELGDFALLLQTGVSIRKAMIFNVVSSVLSFIGMIIGLIVAGIHTSLVRWIYAGTAGTFLYIALADLIPEMGRDIKANSKTPCRSICGNLVGIFLGGLIMLAIALNEDRLKILFE